MSGKNFSTPTNTVRMLNWRSSTLRPLGPKTRLSKVCLGGTGELYPMGYATGSEPDWVKDKSNNCHSVALLLDLCSATYTSSSCVSLVAPRHTEEGRIGGEGLVQWKKGTLYHYRWQATQSRDWSDVSVLICAIRTWFSTFLARYTLYARSAVEQL